MTFAKVIQILRLYLQSVKILSLEKKNHRIAVTITY